MRQFFRVWVLALVPVIAGSGCVSWGMAPRLAKRTMWQETSDMDLRYEEVLYNLAMIAREPTSLPVYAPIYAGTPAITDNAQISNSTALQHFIAPSAFEGFAQDSLNPQLQRQDVENWSLDPIIVPEKLEAMRACCQWVIYGPDFATRDHPGLLLSPDEFPVEDRDRHFNVADQLSRIPNGWLHWERRVSPPHGAAFKARCGDMWAWVTPEGVAGLSDFTLVIQNIARVDINSLTLFSIGMRTSSFSFLTMDKGYPYPKGQVEATVYVNEGLFLTADNPYYRWRVEGTSTNASLRTQISTAGLR
jgi:hypothetical protein